MSWKHKHIKLEDTCSPELGAQTEVFIGGDFVASWQQLSVSETDKGKIESMLRAAFDAGRKDKAAELREVLGVTR